MSHSFTAGREAASARAGSGTHPQALRSGLGALPLYGISFLRPLARRRASTLRPFWVAMRARNPCVRLRRSLLG